MVVKRCGDKIVTIRKITKKDLVNAKQFLDFVNSIVEEEAKVLMNKKLTLREEREYLGKTLVGMKKKTGVYLVAECDGRVVGTTEIKLCKAKQSHVGTFGIIVRQEYRGIGVGTCLMDEILRLAKKEISPTPKIISLGVYANNKPAIGLYKKMGFKTVARIPKQLQHKGKLIDEAVMLLYLKRV